MKAKWMVLLALVVSCGSAMATSNFTYYIYTETDYTQGPWTRADILNDQSYLEPHEREGLFGSELIDLASAIVEELSINDPAKYNWNKDLTIQGDTVVIAAQDKEAADNVTNEIVASLTLNGFAAVTFNIGDVSNTLTLDDLTIPYFDLVRAAPVETATASTSADQQPQPESNLAADHKATCDRSKCHGSGSIGLIISLLLNAILVILLIRRKR